MLIRMKAKDFFREATGVETIEYAIATALLIAGVLIGVGGILLAMLPVVQKVSQTIFGI